MGAGYCTKREQISGCPNMQSTKYIESKWVLDTYTFFVTGKSAQDPAKFNKAFLADEEKQVCRSISNPRFHGLTNLRDEVYEVIHTPKRVVFKDPLQIAYFVYATSKLTMLSFVYDFLDVYFPRTAYEICCTDTDSLYFAYAANDTNDIEDWVKPQLREQYFRNRGRFYLPRLVITMFVLIIM